jgi:DNA gyrase subunit A
MLVTDGGQLIRCPVADIRIAGRNTQGVSIFKVAEGERVVSVTRLEEIGEAGASNGADAGDEPGSEGDADSLAAGAAKDEGASE